jgi:hypothetical protein
MPASSSPVSEEEGNLIQEIQHQDNEKLNEIGFELKDLAEQIEAITKFPGLFEQNFQLNYKDSQGTSFTARCLFCNKAEEDKVHYEIINLQTGRSLTISKIALHSMTHHNFCGFPGTDRRIQPEDLKWVLRPPQTNARSARNLPSRIVHFFRSHGRG